MLMLLCPFQYGATSEGSYVRLVHHNGGLSDLTYGYLRLGKDIDLEDGIGLSLR